MRPVPGRVRATTAWRWAWAVTTLAAASFATRADDTGWQVRHEEPRAFGQRVGDLVERRIHIEPPAGLVLDPASLPSVGRRGKALELRTVDWAAPGWFGGRGHTLTLVYQVFLSPPEVRTLEMPVLTLRFDGGARTEELRIDAWPMSLSPLAPDPPSPRTGLGELRPEAAPLPLDTTPARRRLLACAALALLALAYLAQVYLLAPWWAGRRRPFARAWLGLRIAAPAGDATARQQAYRALHRALDETAGAVVFEPGVAEFLAAHPRFRPVQAELGEFFARSRAEFFGKPGETTGDAAAWLRQLCRRCRDLERGAA